MGYADSFPVPYQYNPNQSFDPAEIPPPPPGYGEKGGNYLLPDESVANPNYLPTDSQGRSGSEWGPPPPTSTFYATNVPETAQKWGKSGQDYTFLAESPGAMARAKEIGAPQVMKGYRDEEVKPASTFDPGKTGFGPEPKDGEVNHMKKFGEYWNHHVGEVWKGTDPLTINPAEEGVKAEEEARKKYALELLQNPTGSVDYKKYEGLIAEAKKDATKRAEWQRTMGEQDYKKAKGFFDEAYPKAVKEKQQSGARIEASQKYTDLLLQDPHNYELTPEDVAPLAVKNSTYFPKNRKLKEGVLDKINLVRKQDGLDPIVENQTNVPMQEKTVFPGTDARIPFTGITKSTEKGFQYKPQVNQTMTLPTQATAELSEGVHVTFKNGQTWTLQNGRPVRIK